MNRTTALKILDIQEIMRADSRYQSLYTEYDMRNKRFLEIIETLTPEQRDIVFDYIGCLIEVQHKTLEIALE